MMFVYVSFIIVWDIFVFFLINSFDLLFSWWLICFKFSITLCEDGQQAVSGMLCWYCVVCCDNTELLIQCRP